MNKDPFANFKITLKKVDRGYLTMDEIKTIMKKKFPTARLEQIRDIFVFACFTNLDHKEQATMKRGKQMIIKKKSLFVSFSV